jgi:hypothetical protein
MKSGHQVPRDFFRVMLADCFVASPLQWRDLDDEPPLLNLAPVHCKTRRAFF